MSYSDFLERLAQYKGIDVDEVIKHPDYRYAVKCRDRGKAYVGKIDRILSHSIDGRRVLDVGCAYGGITIELAIAGADASGIEVVPSYIDLAKQNARKEAKVDFFIGDLTLRSTSVAIKKYDARAYDTFVINHVLEHIYDSEGLFQNIDLLASEDAVIIFDVPNGFAIQSYLAEGHTGIFGVSVSDPDCWHYFGKPAHASITEDSNIIFP